MIHGMLRGIVSVCFLRTSENESIDIKNVIDISFISIRGMGNLPKTY